MPQTPSAAWTYQIDRLKPFVSKFEYELPIDLAPSTNYAKGTILGRITSSANEVQTIDTTGTYTSGTFTLSGVNPHTGLSFTTAALAYNVSNANLQAELEKFFGSGNVAVSSGPMPADTTITFQGALAARPIPLMTLANSMSGGSAATVVKTTTGRTANTYKAYASGNSDGSEDGHCILPFACSTDASGLVSLTPTGGAGGFQGEKLQSVSAFFAGIFRTTDLVGFDNVTNLGNTKWALVTPGIVRLI